VNYRRFVGAWTGWIAWTALVMAAEPAPKLVYEKKLTRTGTIQATFAASGLPAFDGKWHYLGPFNNTDRKGFATVYPPEKEVDLTKDEIRGLSKRAGLPTWDEPASACLSSRIPYDHEVTEDKLRMIERAEDVLRDLGFRVCRVRHHDAVARLEIAPEEMPRAVDPAVRAILARELRALGFQYVALDLQGYRVGSLNETLRLKPL